MAKTLLLLRHAQAEDTRPGHRDAHRQLTATGREQAAAVGRWLAEHHRVDAVLCSPAVRARETLAELGTGAPAEERDELYDAGSDTIAALIRELPAEVGTALVVGHAPGIPALARDLADPDRSDPAALAVLGSRFPAAALAVLEFEGEWGDLATAALSGLRLPTDQ